DERYQIAILAKAGHDKSEIARLMERHKSTISREMTRNRGARGYRPKQAHARSQSRIRAAENSPRSWCRMCVIGMACFRIDAAIKCGRGCCKFRCNRTTTRHAKYWLTWMQEADDAATT
ncbi:helix-turn-helix domain-containing protein, partial [Thiobacillus denitrificans]|uniref:helix-turn-helix domain-containing protein n=1 Tax=Thiobacillus denitrificans TaxID=36861 RepID=UPI00192CF2E2